MVRDPWQVVMSTDHPNGGSFLAYPQIIRLLMDSGYRAAKLQEVSRQVLKRTRLADLKREYSLLEVATIVSAGPAKILGLKNKGRLSVGADADITVYTPNQNYEEMFAWPTYVIKAGELIVEDGEFRQQVNGKTRSTVAEYNSGDDGKIERWFDDNYSISSRSFGV